MCVFEMRAVVLRASCRGSCVSHRFAFTVDYACGFSRKYTGARPIELEKEQSPHVKPCSVQVGWGDILHWCEMKKACVTATAQLVP